MKLEKEIEKILRSLAADVNGGKPDQYFVGTETQLFLELFSKTIDKVIGEDEVPAPHDDLADWNFGKRNALRHEQRHRKKELLK